MRGLKWSTEQDDRLLTQYRAGVPMDSIVRAFSPVRSRSVLYRRLQLLGEPAREPKKKRAGYYVPIVVYPTAHRLVKELLQEAKEQRVNCKDLAAGGSVTREAVNYWNRGGHMMVHNLEAAGAHLGLKLVWREDDE